MKRPEEAKVKKMAVKAEKSWVECALQDVKETTNTLAQLFFLPRPFLLFKDVEEGCVSISSGIFLDSSPTLFRKLLR